MKREILKIIEFFFLVTQKIKFNIFINSRAKKNNIIFIDIDNTIADTWPTLKDNKYINEFERHSSLAIFLGMKNFIDTNFLTKENNIIIYLSARNFRLNNVTNNWLKNNTITSPNSFLILVPKPLFKLYFLKKAIHKKIEITYIDDLSYNHEKNEIKFYESIIYELKKLNINYIGFEEINKINNVLQNN